MPWVGWLEVADTVLINNRQTLTYVRDLMGDARFSIASDTVCECSVIDTGFTDPIGDAAPWYDASEASSEDFYGVVLDNIEIPSVLARATRAKSRQGSSVGPLRPRARVLAFSGNLYARTEPAMWWGMRWLTDQLAGSITGCADDAIRILPYCPDSETLAQAARTLTRVGIADGPNFSPISQELRSCVVRRVGFQLVAGNPYMRTQSVACLEGATLA